VEKALVSHKSNASQRLGLRSSTPEQLEPWVDHGAAVKSSVAASVIRSLGSSITAQSFLAELHAIVDPEPTRFIADHGNVVAAANIKQAFESLGLQTEVQDLIVSPALNQYVAPSHAIGGNILAYMKGTTSADELVIVAAHYDSVNWKDITKPAPGVDDNASGVALALLLAKALKELSVQRSILFVIFNAEEEGLVGSKQFAKLFAHGGTGQARFGRPVAALVADEVAYRGPKTNSQDVIFETKGQTSATNTVVDTLAHVARDQCSGDASSCVNGFVVNYHGFGSDHIPLLDVGIPAVLLIERNNMLHADRWGHSEEDTYEHINPGFGAATTRLALEAVATLATPKQ
jgi:Zn-dependent M28 family amino/carboxypeptidase